MSRERLDKALKERVLVLDGAMGTMIQKFGLEEADFRGARFAESTFHLKGCNDILTLSRPEIISRIHTEYLEAGADIIETDTFNANAISLAEYGLSDSVEDICRAGASLARQAVDQYCITHNIAADRRPFVAGSMGPTGVALSLAMQQEDPQCDFGSMAEAYREQAMALINGGVDILMLETIFDTLNAKAAIYGIKQALRESGRDLPLMLSVTLSEQGHLLSGQTLEEFVEATAHSGAVSIGLNCGFGAEQLLPHAERLSELSEAYISTHPNAGLPDAMGCYNDSPEKMCREIRSLLDCRLVNIVGGCCGTTPEHIRHIAAEVSRARPRARRPRHNDKKEFLKIGERCNVAGSRKFLRLVNSGEWGETLGIAADQLSKGARMLDINMDDPMLNAPQAMSRFLKLLATSPATASVPLMIDSSDFQTICCALRLTPLKATVNSISLKNGESEFIERAREIYDLGGAMVVMAFDERGQADTLPRRIEICARAYDLLTRSAGIPASEIIFDPNVLAVGTGIKEHERYALDFIEAARWIKHNLPGARVSGGVSNLSFAFRGNDPVRKAMHSIFLEHAIRNGMDMAIINPATPLSSEWIDPELREMIEDLLLCRNADATERLLSRAIQIKAEIDARKENAAKPSKPAKEEPAKDPATRLNLLLTEGDTTRLEDLLREVLQSKGSAMMVVTDVLMEGMNRVGNLFARGEIFLPQVVRSASVMRKAVEILTPVVEAEQTTRGIDSEKEKMPIVVLATVKGDVHDIGKNIVAVVLRCSGYSVVDLGVMVPPEKILDEAERLGAAAIGLSGLITPSLQEMVTVAEMMHKRRMKIPLFVGGATTSDLHTAIMIAPQRDGAVVHTEDAASLPGALARFTGPEAEYHITQLFETQEGLRRKYALNAARMNAEEAALRNDAVSEPAPKPKCPGSHLFHIPIAELIPLINRRALLHEWGLPPNAGSDNAEAIRLLEDAGTTLQSLRGTIQAKVVILPALSDRDSITACLSDQKIRIPTYRSRTPNPVTGKCVALSDFVFAGGDYIGVFTATAAGSGIPEKIESLRQADEYTSLLLQSISHRLAEAATEWLHRKVRRDLWGTAPDCGIRPAVGYSSLPEQEIMFELDKILDFGSLGIKITEHGALYPSATTAGLIIAHPHSRYFDTDFKR